MEKDREIAKLVNVLRTIAGTELPFAQREGQPDAAHFFAAQYNKVLARLGELEPGVARVFAPLGEDATLHVARMAARDLATYFEDEVPERGGARWQGRHYGRGCRPRVIVGFAHGGRRFC